MIIVGPRSNQANRSLEQALLALAALPCLCLAGCSSFKLDVSSPEPIKVDVSMRLDVYQYKGDEPEKPDAAQVSYEDAVGRLRNRMAEIQKLKDNALVGEDHRGMLHLREKPAGEWGDYVEKTVNAENEDRMLLMRKTAKDTNRMLHEVQEEQWKLRTDKAFKSEWIELPGDRPNTFRWAQASGPKLKKPLAGNETKDEKQG